VFAIFIRVRFGIRFPDFFVKTRLQLLKLEIYTKYSGKTNEKTNENQNRKHSIIIITVGVLPTSDLRLLRDNATTDELRDFEFCRDLN
jgi:hypothetical protein